MIFCFVLFLVQILGTFNIKNAQYFIVIIIKYNINNKNYSHSPVTIIFSQPSCQNIYLYNCIDPSPQNEVMQVSLNSFFYDMTLMLPYVISNSVVPI